jgi:signal peptidase I
MAAAAHLLVGAVVVPRVPGVRSVYLVQPGIWAVVAVVAFVAWRRSTRSSDRTAGLVPLALLIGTFQVALWLTLGLINGFGRSPYSHEGWALLGNGAFVVAPLLAREFTRATLVDVAGRRFPTLAVVATGIALGAISIPYVSYGSITDAATLFRFTGEHLLPALAMSLLASVLVAAGGPAASIAYLGLVAAFEWLSPLLPATEWIAVAFVGTMGPIIGLIVVRDHLGPETAEPVPPSHEGRGWRTAAVMSVTFIFFSNGLLGLQPMPVVGGSMAPTWHTGDLVITRTVAPQDVAVGDVIRYRSGNDFVLHRVVAIWDGGAQLQFMTRGDANDADDPPVPADLLAGKVLWTIPKVGWLPIKARQLLAEVLS